MGVSGEQSPDSTRKVLGISIRTLQRWELGPGIADQRQGPNRRPVSALSEAEKQLIVAIATSPQFRDLSSSQIDCFSLVKEKSYNS